jgi:hypothetical protein
MSNGFTPALTRFYKNVCLPNRHFGLCALAKYWLYLQWHCAEFFKLAAFDWIGHS